MANVGRDNGVQSGTCVASVSQVFLTMGIVQEGASSIAPIAVDLAAEERFLGEFFAIGRLERDVATVEYSLVAVEVCCLFWILADARRFEPADASASDCSKY